MSVRMPSRARQRAGNVLATVLVGMAIVLITVGSFLYVGTQGVRMVQRWRTGDQMMLVAQSAMERAKMDILNNFTNYAENAANYMTGFNWFNTWNSTSLGQTYVYAAPQNVAYSNCAITITIVSVSTSGWMSRDVVVQCRATNSSVPGLVRGVQETIRYQMGRSPIFNHAYFINNFGWLYGSGITVQGDVRANGNFAFQSGPKVNVDVFAATNS